LYIIFGQITKYLKYFTAVKMTLYFNANKDHGNIVVNQWYHYHLM